ncbi:MAG TPA: lysylphosphatidylglycerol synthase transmembrane domain-containing protein [Ktedonobacteraceae bacterium]|nr:lysylphosphatidylglycerol synthase transmembrane domain-containing protein [Ktedonobacteraceae bacterium]
MAHGHHDKQEQINANHAPGNDIAMQPTVTMQSVASPDTPTYLESQGSGYSRPAQGDARPSAPARQNSHSQFQSPQLAHVPPHPHSYPGIPEDDISTQSTLHLMRLSGMMPAVRVRQKGANGNQVQAPVADLEEGYWPHGIQQTGPFPVVNLYGSEPFGRTLPLAAVATPVAPAEEKQMPKWKQLLNTPAVKVALGLLVGGGLLFLVSRFVDLPTTIQVLRQHLTTPRGILFALLSGVAFLMAFSIRGMRWKLFLNPIGKVSTFKAIQLFLVGIFLNFLLPIRGGEVAKSLMLKRTANIPISKSLPTVAMDKALDLLPALFIMAIVPFLGISMDIKLWLVLATVGGLLICLIFFVALAAWKRAAAINLLQKMTGLLPKAIGSKIEGFATGFVDSLLAAASQPKIFIPAVLLTCVAIIFDGLFAMLAFWTIGYYISFGTAIFGYTVYNMFYILPTPPGQVGSNEAVGLLVFYGLLHLQKEQVTAMFVFSHPWAALLMTVSGMVCLSALGLKLSTAMKVQTEGEDALAVQAVPAKA